MIIDTTGKLNLFLPFNSDNSTMILNPVISLSCEYKSLDTDSTVPPVAKRSSIIRNEL